MTHGGGRGRYYRGRGRRRGGGGRGGSREGQEDDAVNDDPEEVRLARLKRYYINLFIDKARVLETGCTNGEKYELAARSERCLMRGIQPPSTGCGKANTMVAAPVIKALTEALDELPPAMGARIAVLACVCLLEKGSSALACSTIMQAVRSSRCLSSLLPACPPSSSEEASVPPSSLLCPDSRSITAFLDISLTAIFEGRTKPRTPKLLVSFLESIAPTIPFLTSCIFRQVLLSASSHDVLLEILKRCEEVHGREHLRPLGLAEGLLQVLLSFGHYKMAYLASRELGLSQTYPFVERLFREDRIKKMVAKNKWQFAQAMIHGLQERIKRKEEERKAAKALRQAVAAAGGEVLIAEEEEKEEEMENEVRKGEIRHLCACLVRALMSKPGQLSRAAALRKVYGLEDMIEEPDAQALAAEAEARATLYLELPIPLEKVLMVDSIETLDRAREVLGRLVPRAEESWKEGRPEVIGLDVEWRPGLYQFYDDKNAKKEATAAEGDIEVDTDVVVVEGGGDEEDINKPAADNREIAREGGVNLLVIKGGGGGEEETSKQAQAANNKEIASILQIASRDEVLIMDLWALCGRDARLLEQFNACLTLVFQDSKLLKLGFGFSSDMQVLQNAWPEVSAFRSIRGALDIADIGVPSPSTTITSTSAADGHPMVCGSHRLPPRSLTGFCKEWLGKELDKGEQVSDWDLRPLTTEQVRYAALDAWVLTSIFDQKLNEQEAVDSGPSDQRGRPFWTRLTVDLGRGGNRVETGWFEGDEDGSSRSPPSVEEVINRAKEAGLLSGQPITFHDEEEALETVVVNGGEGDQAREEEGAAGVASMTTTRKDMKWMRTKSLALMVDQKLMASTSSASSSAATAPVLVVAPQKSRVQIARVATALGLPRRALRLAYPQECRKVLGYAPGFIPPIAHRARTRLVLDQSLHLTNTSQPMRLICGAGTSGRVFTCLSQDLLALGGPASMVVAVCHTSSPPRPVEVLQLKKGEEEDRGNPSTVSGGREEQEAAAVDDARNGQQVVAAIEDDLDDRPQLAFLLDGMLGRLCKWMRVVGIDVEFFESRPVKGGTLQALKAPNPPSIIAQAHRTNRIIITKDRKLINSRWYSTLNVMSYLVRGEDVREQLEDIVRYFNIRCKEDDIMSRCSVCNSKGYKELSRVEVEKRGDVPPKVLAHVSTFWECLNPSCSKLFWEGPKFDSAKAKFDRLIAELGEMMDGGEQGGGSRAMLGDEEEEVEEGDGGDELVGHYRPLTVIMRDDRKVFEEEEENGTDEGETERHRPLIVNSKELMEVEKTFEERGVSGEEEEEDGGEEWENYQALAAAVRKEDGMVEERGEGEEWEKYRPMTLMMKEDRKVVEEEEEEEEEVGREEWEQYQPLAVITKEGDEEPEEEEEEEEVGGEWEKDQLMTLMMKEDRLVEEREVVKGEAEGLKAEDVGLCDVGGTTDTVLKEKSLEVHQNEGISFIEEGKGEGGRPSVYTLPSAERKNGWMAQQGCVVH